MIVSVQAPRAKTRRKSVLTRFVYVLIPIAIAFLIVKGKEAMDAMTARAAGEVGAAIRAEIQKGLELVGEREPKSQPAHSGK